MPSILAENVTLNYPVFGVPRSTPDVAEEDADRDRLEAPVPVKAATSAVIQALKDVSFEVGSGERLGIVGRNGSGKSTLLRVLGGIYEPDEGQVTVSGAVAPLFNVGLGVRREATGRRNIVLRGLMRGLTHKQAEAKIPEIVEFSELHEFIDMPVRTYSTGMAMRLSFAMATAFEPEILLIDEWLGAGDQSFQKKARARMFELMDTAGITVLASHREGLLRKVCSKCVWLDGGIMRAFGSIDEVLDAFMASEEAR